jgi:hypothetical protein
VPQDSELRFALNKLAVKLSSSANVKFRENTFACIYCFYISKDVPSAISAMINACVEAREQAKFAVVSNEMSCNRICDSVACATTTCRLLRLTQDTAAA